MRAIVLEKFGGASQQPFLSRRTARRPRSYNRFQSAYCLRDQAPIDCLLTVSVDTVRR